MRDFELEQRVQADARVRAALPQYHAADANATGAVRSPSGFAYPPFAVMERGALTSTLPVLYSSGRCGRGVCSAMLLSCASRSAPPGKQWAQK
jgi:hypothetical protein